MEKAAKALLGAASGGVLGMIAAGLLRVNTWVAIPIMLAGALGLGIANMRLPSAPLPIPSRVLLGGLLASGSLVLTLSVLLTQSIYVDVVTRRGGNAEMPLPIWPASRIALYVSVSLGLLGLLLTLAGWFELSRNRARYSGGRFITMSILAALSTFAMALVVFLAGHGFTW